MSLPTTDLDIANMALGNLGHTVQIVNLATDSTTEAKNARLYLDSERDRCLAEYRWRWAEKRAVLTESTGTGDWWDMVHEDWQYVYALPADCVQPRALWPGTRNPAPRDTEPFDQRLDSAGTAKVLVCDVKASTVAPNKAPVLLYTWRNTTVTQYPQPFVDFLAWALAVKLALPVKGDQGQVALQTALAMRKIAFVEAARFDLQSYAHDQAPTTPSLAARGAMPRLGQKR